ncbi:MAG: EAL domain-containing protein [Coriobacteriales bacterium]|nr:EAL domain-containing protein [Coriobacteriales bacterium]
MQKITRARIILGLDKRNNFVRRFFAMGNMRSAIYMSAIVTCLEVWMILSLLRSYFDHLAAGKYRDLAWLIDKGGWYVMLLSVALVVLAYSIQYMRGKAHGKRMGTVLLFVFSVACIAFGYHYGNNSYVQGEQMLTFTTMTLFVFGMLIWSPWLAIIGSIITFGGYYLFINSNLPATYGTQVNLFTLWISTVIVAIAAYHQKRSEAKALDDLRDTNQRLRYLASYDALTEIPNMHSFTGVATNQLRTTHQIPGDASTPDGRPSLSDMDSSEVMVMHAVPEDKLLSVLYLDIENFKAYNERYGFLAGDELLFKLAEGLQHIFADGLVARFSDDHFVALCVQDEVERHVAAASELVESLRREVRLSLKAGAYTPSFADAHTPEAKAGATSDFNHVDSEVNLACDKARIACNGIKKMADRNLSWYDNDLDRDVQRRTHVINSIERAVSDGWIKVFYQPVVRCNEEPGKLCGYEALARWNDPVYGLLPPFAFIETLEEHREIDKLDRCIIEQVCRDLHAEIEAGHDPVPVSLNFSRLDFELYDVPAFLMEMSRKYEVPANLLDVEITESALTEQLGELQQNMARLREGGFSQWLDDFGSGYSSLNVLKDFHFDVLKIDMAFLRGFESNPKSRPILANIVNLARELDLITLCEGVETREQFDFLHDIGCNRAQGYYFGKPEPSKAEPKAL